MGAPEKARRSEIAQNLAVFSFFQQKGTKAMASSKIVTVDQQNFKSAVLQSDKPVLIDFWASWCGPCRMVAPLLDELADELDGKLQIAKVNVDENQELAMQFRISSIPAFLLFKNGEVVERAAGAMPKAMFKSLVAEHI